MAEYRIHIEDFNLNHSLGCGQTFRWNFCDGWWQGVAGGQVIKIRQAGKELVSNCPDRSFLKNYFRLDDDLPAILSEINKDEKIGKAIEKLRGLRVIRQEPWECLVSYVCSRNSSIKHISRVVENISSCFGNRLEFQGKTFHSFPEPEVLASAEFCNLMKCSFRYGRIQAEEIRELARLVSKGFNLEGLKKISYEEAKKELLQLPGVGEKVADCVLLFSLEKLEAFPVDVWISRVMHELYLCRNPSEGKMSLKKIGEFGRGYFGRYAGYAQEYLFHYIRLESQKMKSGKSGKKL